MTVLIDPGTLADGQTPGGGDQRLGRVRLSEHLGGAVAVRGGIRGAGDEDDRDAGIAELIEEFVALFGAEMDVEEDDIRALVAERRPRRCEAGGLAHHESLELEVDACQQPQRRIVLDDEDRVPWTLHPGPRW